MKTLTKSKANQQIDSVWIPIALLCAFVIFVAIALHITPSHIISLIEDFATHHFILMTMVVFFITLLTLRNYYKKHNITNPVRNLKRRKKAEAKMNFVNQVKSKISLEYQIIKSHFVGIYEIESLTFAEKDVLTDDESKAKRFIDLTKAMKLGNSYKVKVKIYFKDSVSNKHLYTSVWFVSSSHVTLKHGMVIPIKSIYQVKF